MSTLSKHYPEWLRKKLPAGSSADTEEILLSCGVNTVCNSALCPNRSECYAKKRATFMIMGRTCTRNCGFCEVEKGTPKQIDHTEPERIAQAATELNLEHVVITSVARDDLPDGGAKHFADCIRTVRKRLPNSRIEVLTPDFQGSEAALKIVLEAHPDVFNHNLETVPRLYSLVRPEADYERSLAILRCTKEISPNITTKSGLMVGLGETDREVEETLGDIFKANCDIVTIGQYLKPPHGRCEVNRYVEPATFKRYRECGKRLGFKAVFADPFVRSSYEAEELYEALQGRR